MMLSARAEAELATLRRGFTQAFTSLELGRRTWARLSDDGKRALVSCTNSSLRLAYAEGAHWGALGRCGEVRRGVALRALRQQQAAQTELQPVMAELEAIVAKMCETTRALGERLGKAAATLGDTRTREAPLFDSGLSAVELLTRLDSIASAYARELELRRALASELASGRAGQELAGWEGSARLSLSAWVLQVRSRQLAPRSLPGCQIRPSSATQACTFARPSLCLSACSHPPKLSLTEFSPSEPSHVPRPAICAAASRGGADGLVLRGALRRGAQDTGLGRWAAAVRAEEVM